MKCFVVVEAYLRMQGIQVYPYLNDWLIRGSTFQQVSDNVQHILQLFATLGFKISVAKSSFVPSQNIKYAIAKAYLLKARFKTMAGMIKTSNSKVVESHGFFVIQTARLHTHCMQGWLKSIHHPSRHHIDMPVHIFPSCPEVTRLVEKPQADMPRCSIFSSSSLKDNRDNLSWIAHLDQHQCLYSQEEICLHINILEQFVSLV